MDTLFIIKLERHRAVENLFLIVEQRRHRANDAYSILQHAVAHVKLLSRLKRDESLLLAVFENLFNLLLHERTLLAFKRIRYELLLSDLFTVTFLLARLRRSLRFDFWLRFVLQARRLLVFVEIAFQRESFSALFTRMWLKEKKSHL